MVQARKLVIVAGAAGAPSWSCDAAAMAPAGTRCQEASSLAMPFSTTPSAGSCSAGFVSASPPMSPQSRRTGPGCSRSGAGPATCRPGWPRGFDVTGLDLDPAMIARARANTDPAVNPGRRQPSFLVGDAAALAFPDGSFDLVVSTLSMHHWADPAAAWPRSAASCARRPSAHLGLPARCSAPSIWTTSRAHARSGGPHTWLSASGGERDAMALAVEVRAHPAGPVDPRRWVTRAWVRFLPAMDRRLTLLLTGRRCRYAESDDGTRAPGRTAAPAATWRSSPSRPAVRTTASVRSTTRGSGRPGLPASWRPPGRAAAALVERGHGWVDPDQEAALRRCEPPSASSRSCGSSTMTTARTRTTTRSPTKARRHRRPTGSVQVAGGVRWYTTR